MRRKNVLVFGVCFVLAAALGAQAAGDSKKAKTSTKAAAAPKATAMLASDLKWVEIPDAGGSKIADVYGDHTKGAFGAFIKFPAGFAAPLHTHTHDFKLVVVSGTIIHTPEGKPEIRLTPGSYLKQPGGKYRHATGCDKASECIMYAEGSGAFDLIPVDAAKK